MDSGDYSNLTDFAIVGVVHAGIRFLMVYIWFSSV